MKKEDLVGTWKADTRDSWMHLKADGSAICETRDTDGTPIRESATWVYVDPRHWKLKIEIPPQPHVPGLEEGVIDVSDYEVVAFSPQRMELMLFDNEYPFVYNRVSPQA